VSTVLRFSRVWPGLLYVENELGCNGQVRQIALANVGTEKTAAYRQLRADLIIKPPEKCLREVYPLWSLPLMGAASFSLSPRTTVRGVFFYFFPQFFPFAFPILFCYFTMPKSVIHPGVENTTRDTFFFEFYADCIIIIEKP